MHNRVAAACRLALVLLISGCLATAQHPTGQSTHPITGRRIAPVMGLNGADWLDREDRAREEQPEKALAALNLHAGMMVGDVGAGTGYYSLKIARRISPGGIVYANDIQQGMLERLRDKAIADDITNVKTILGTNTDTRFPAGQLDLVLLVDVYHEFAYPQKMLASIWQSLKPDGRLVLLEYRKEDPNVPIQPEHKMSLREVKAELTPEGFRFEKAVETLPWQHMIFFRKSFAKPNAASQTAKLGR